MTGLAHMLWRRDHHRHMAAKDRMQTGDPGRLLLLRWRATHLAVITISLTATIVGVLAGVFAVKCLLEGLTS